MSRERLTAAELREVEEDKYLVVELHEDEYWMQGEGTVTHVTERDSGKVEVGMRGHRGHLSRLHIPADARSGLRFDGAAKGAHDLRVEGVYAR